MGSPESLVGKRFGSLTVLTDSGERAVKTIIWECACDCGVRKLVTTNHLNRGAVKSCGCQRWKARLPPGEAGFKELYRSYERDSRNKRRQFDLTPDQFRCIVERACRYCGSPPSKIKYGRSNKPDSEATIASAFTYNGVDRVDSSIGYTIENTVPCCHMCNMAKRDLPVEEFLAWIDQLVTYRKDTNMS